MSGLRFLKQMADERTMASEENQRSSSPRQDVDSNRASTSKPVDEDVDSAPPEVCASTPTTVRNITPLVIGDGPTMSQSKPTPGTNNFILNPNAASFIPSGSTTKAALVPEMAQDVIENMNNANINSSVEETQSPPVSPTPEVASPLLVLPMPVHDAEPLGLETGQTLVGGGTPTETRGTPMDMARTHLVLGRTSIETGITLGVRGTSEMETTHLVWRGTPGATGRIPLGRVTPTELGRTPFVLRETPKNRTPLVARETPTETGSTPPVGRGTPTETGGTPVFTRGTPEPGRTPFVARENPTEMGRTVLVGRGTPTETGRTPLVWKGTPTETGGTPVVTRGTPEPGETPFVARENPTEMGRTVLVGRGTPTETGRTPLGWRKTPTETAGTSVVIRGTPEPGGTPFVAREHPTETGRTLLVGRGTPTETERTPVVWRGTPTGTGRTSVVTRGTPEPGGTPFVAREHSTEMGRTLLVGRGTPTETGRTPLGWRGTPTETGRTLGWRVTPTETGRTPLGWRGTPTETGRTPLVWRETPTETGRTPLVGRGTPTETGRTLGWRGTPIETERTPLGWRGTPKETGRTPLGWRGTLTETERTPLGWRETPTETGKTPLAWRGTPTETGRTPVVTRGTPEPGGTPFVARENPTAMGRTLLVGKGTPTESGRTPFVKRRVPIRKKETFPINLKALGIKEPFEYLLGKSIPICETSNADPGSSEYDWDTLEIMDWQQKGSSKFIIRSRVKKFKKPGYSKGSMPSTSQQMNEDRVPASTDIKDPVAINPDPMETQTPIPNDIQNPETTAKNEPASIGIKDPVAFNVPAPTDIKDLVAINSPGSVNIEDPIATNLLAAPNDVKDLVAISKPTPTDFKGLFAINRDASGPEDGLGADIKSTFTTGMLENVLQFLDGGNFPDGKENAGPETYTGFSTTVLNTSDAVEIQMEASTPEDFDAAINAIAAMVPKDFDWRWNMGISDEDVVNWMVDQGIYEDNDGEGLLGIDGGQTSFKLIDSDDETVGQSSKEESSENVRLNIDDNTDQIAHCSYHFDVQNAFDDMKKENSEDLNLAGNTDQIAHGSHDLDVQAAFNKTKAQTGQNICHPGLNKYVYERNDPFMNMNILEGHADINGVPLDMCHFEIGKFEFGAQTNYENCGISCFKLTDEKKENMVDSEIGKFEDGALINVESCGISFLKLNDKKEESMAEYPEISCDIPEIERLMKETEQSFLNNGTEKMTKIIDNSGLRMDIKMEECLTDDMTVINIDNGNKLVVLNIGGLTCSEVNGESFEKFLNSNMNQIFEKPGDIEHGGQLNAQILVEAFNSKSEVEIVREKELKSIGETKVLVTKNDADHEKTAKAEEQLKSIEIKGLDQKDSSGCENNNKAPSMIVFADSKDKVLDVKDNVMLEKNDKGASTTVMADKDAQAKAAAGKQKRKLSPGDVVAEATKEPIKMKQKRKLSPGDVVAEATKEPIKMKQKRKLSPGEVVAEATKEPIKMKQKRKLSPGDVVAEATKEPIKMKKKRKLSPGDAVAAATKEPDIKMKQKRKLSPGDAVTAATKEPDIKMKQKRKLSPGDAVTAATKEPDIKMRQRRKLSPGDVVAAATKEPDIKMAKKSNRSKTTRKPKRIQKIAGKDKDKMKKNALEVSSPGQEVIKFEIKELQNQSIPSKRSKHCRTAKKKVKGSTKKNAGKKISECDNQTECTAKIEHQSRSMERGKPREAMAAKRKADEILHAVDKPLDKKIKPSVKLERFKAQRKPSTKTVKRSIDLRARTVSIKQYTSRRRDCEKSTSGKRKVAKFENKIARPDKVEHQSRPQTRTKYHPKTRDHAPTRGCAVPKAAKRKMDDITKEDEPQKKKQKPQTVMKIFRAEPVNKKCTSTRGKKDKKITLPSIYDVKETNKMATRNMKKATKRKSFTTSDLQGLEPEAKKGKCNPTPEKFTAEPRPKKGLPYPKKEDVQTSSTTKYRRPKRTAHSKVYKFKK